MKKKLKMKDEKKKIIKSQLKNAPFCTSRIVDTPIFQTMQLKQKLNLKILLYFLIFYIVLVIPQHHQRVSLT